ncbi:MAG: site-2 protease family protein [Euryarchaeota archaeon]|nr:site-2 protease family protein [Euryarchaeota archaeon]MBV1729547.1 site-2 protease family protein [Methanobacterium sp.]MBU4547346.1 site-2 protease family protein [Euryarchaeota archaeon]MBU4607753.1 site-2 protease family protein [Euryarchaeota archaeon]MBV1754031.1 site-2 protease family protein [Methanobacterium sp.]
MNALWFYAIAFVVIWIMALLFRDKLKIDIQGPIIMRKTQKMKGFIDRTAQRHTRLWKWMLNLGIPITFIAMFAIVFVLIQSLETLFVAPQVTLIIPGVDLPGSPITPPLGYGLLGIATVMIVHEFGHGILARVEGVEIKSIGVLLLAILPGAFVEPDEEQIKKIKRIPRLRILAAGSFFNFGLALIAFLVVTGITGFAFPATFQNDGIIINNVVGGSPAEGILEEGMILESINGFSISNATTFQEAIQNLEVGQEATFVTSGGTFNLKLGQNPNNESAPYIGIRTSPNQVLKENVASTYGETLPWVWVYLSDALFWIFLINFGVGWFNLLPVKPLDGGLMLEELLKFKLSDNQARPLLFSVSLVLASIVIISIIYGLGRSIMLLL